MLVYDRNNDEAFCLNQTAALVWAHCDGETTVAKMTQLLEVEAKAPVGEEVVWFTLEQLRKSRLLDGSFQGPEQMNLSRRLLVKRLGIAAAVLPVIMSIAAPAAAQAASCGANGALCGSDSDCCSNNCVDDGRGGFQCN